MNIIDLLVIGFLLLGVYRGYAKGLFGSLAGLFANVLGIIAAAKTYPQVGNWLKDRFSLDTILEQYFHDHLVLPRAAAQLKLPSITLPDWSGFLERSSIPDALKPMLNYLQGLRTGIDTLSGINLGEIVQQYLASALVSILAFLLIWLLIANGIVLIAALYRKITKGTVLGGVDSLLGALTGGLAAALILTVLIGLLSPLLTVAEITESSFLTAVQKTAAEARSVPYFVQAFAFLTENFLSIWI